jgi:hypothetical protein
LDEKRAFDDELKANYIKAIDDFFEIYNKQ